MLGTGRVNKTFSQGFYKYLKKIVTDMKLVLTNVSFRHNSACVIQKWLKFKRLVTARLAY